MKNAISLPATMLSILVLSLASIPNCDAQSAPVTLKKSFSGKPVPVFQNGYYTAYDHDELAGAPIAYLFSQDGEIRLRVPLARAGLTQPRIAAVAPACDGGMVVSNGGLADDGRPAFFLTWVDPQGRIARSIPTYPFAAVALHVRPNGELWAAGREFEAPGKLKAAHDILRRYSASGQLIERFLNWSSFPAGLKGHPDSDAYLFGDDTTVGFFSVTAMDLATIDTATGKLHRQHLPPLLEAAWITGAAFSSGSLFVSAQTTGGTPNRKGIFRWEPAASSWRAISVPDQAAEPWTGALLGADNAGLLLADGQQRVFRLPVR